MYLKYNDLELEKVDASWTNFSLYRYAETLLIYAEALNEYEPYNAEIVWAVNQVRKRAGLPESTVNLEIRNECVLLSGKKEGMNLLVNISVILIFCAGKRQKLY